MGIQSNRKIMDVCVLYCGRMERGHPHRVQCFIDGGKSNTYMAHVPIVN